MKKQLIAAATLLTVGLIAGCGGSGDSVMPNQTSTGKSVIAGSVADGYLVNATVFLDRNKNYQLDANEPSATTDQSGSYILNVSANDIGKYPIVALAIAGQTYDLDDLTHTPLSNSYVMSMHAVSVTPSASGDVTGSVKNFISPISTQIREMMETGTYATVDAAIDALRAQMGMPENTNMLDNYIANSNSSMHTAARNMANLMGGQMPQIMPGNKVDVNRYRGMIGSIFSNISSVKGANGHPEISSFIDSMRENLANIVPGQPFRNMSTAFRGGMMAGGNGGMRR